MQKTKIFLFLIIAILAFSIFEARADIEDPFTPVNIFAGWKKGMAFNSDENNFLVAVLSGNNIKAEIVDNKGNALSQPITVNDPGDLTTDPRIAYSPDSQKFLVVYAQLQGSPTSPTNPGHIYGRFISDIGTLAGDDFDLTPEGGLIAFLPDSSFLQYDKTNKKFVLVYRNKASDIRLMTIDLSGQRVISQTVSPPTGTYQSNGSVAVNERTGEYCVIWSTEIHQTNENVADVFARSVKATTGELGPKIQLSTGPVYLPYTNIAWDSDSGKYLAIWSSAKYGDFQGQIFNGLWGLWGRFMDNCSSTPAENDFMISTELGTPSIAYNSASHLFGIAGVATVQANNGMGNGEENAVIYVNANGEGERSPSIFTDFGQTGNESPVISANTVDGTFAVISTKDFALTRFLGGLSTTLQPVQSLSPFASQSAPTAPTGYPPMGDLIAGLLTWSIRILGIAVFVMIFYGGVLWFFSRGNPGEITKAKSKIQNAVLGAILLLSSYLILRTINPDLVSGTFTLPGVGTNQSQK